MFSPPFSVSEEALGLVSEICRLLPPEDGRMTAFPLTLTTAQICAAHAALGGSGAYRTTGQAPHWVPVLMQALVDWFNASQAHPLIRCAVFHHEMLRITPFSAGNARLASQLHTAMLQNVHSNLSGVQLDMETFAAEQSLAAHDATEFITLSLSNILQELKRRAAAPQPLHQQNSPVESLVSFLQQHPGSKRQDILAAIPTLSPRMLDRHLQSLRETGRIEYRGSRKTGAYYAL